MNTQKATMKKPHHFLLISLPAQGHINPIFQLAKILARSGAHVTFATTAKGLSSIKSLPNYDGLSYASFSAGSEQFKKSDDGSRSMAELKRVGSESLAKLIQDFADEDRPVTFLIYSVIVPWAAVVARELQVPSAFLASQSATVLQIHHKFFNSHDGVYDGVREINPEISMKFPGLPLFSSHDLPTFLLPNDEYFSVAAPSFHEHIKNLEEDPKPCVLVNTFNDLEEASIKALENLNVIPIGPLIPSAFTDGNDPEDRTFGCDLFDGSKKDYLQWLDSKPERSVIYVSFGSIVAIKKEQKMEIFHGLAESGKPFLWVIRSSENEDEEVKAAIEEVSNGDQGIIVPWCSQIEVLSHQSIGCFFTHCGWNSTLESLVAGVPMVGCPQFSDQTTNAKMIEEVWGIGIRARTNEEGLVHREDIKKCLDTLMENGGRAEEIRRNAMKWRCLALNSVKEGGSSRINIKMFLESLG